MPNGSRTIGELGRSIDALAEQSQHTHEIVSRIEVQMGKDQEKLHNVIGEVKDIKGVVAQWSIGVAGAVSVIVAIFKTKLGL